jgi:dihydrofolate reductase
MTVALIAAVAENGVIGRGGKLPWHLPADLRHFRKTTLGHHLLVGRRTWESFAVRLPGRQVVVITRNPPAGLPDGVCTFPTLGAGLAAARAAGDDEPMVGGGARLYAEALPLAGRIYLTRVHADLDGDTWFPVIDPAEWMVVAERRQTADERNAWDMTFQVWERRVG